MMTGPLAGTFLKPFTFGRNPAIRNGVRKARKVP